jgi:hypothetical protein
VAEFVFFSGGLHSIHFFRHSDCIYIYSSGYIAVKLGKRVIYFVFSFIRLIICIYEALQTNVLLLLFSYSILVRVEPAG